MNPGCDEAPPERLHGYEYIHRLVSDDADAWNRVKEGQDFGYQAATFHVYRVGAEVTTTDIAAGAPQR